MKEGNSFSQKTHSHPTDTWLHFMLSSNNIHKAKKIYFNMKRNKSFFPYLGIFPYKSLLVICVRFSFKLILKMISFTSTILWWFSQCTSVRSNHCLCMEGSTAIESLSLSINVFHSNERNGSCRWTNMIQKEERPSGVV
jgi:hypothetical protein